ncbi:glycosyltransferase family 4 protein [Vibrio jasicida]|uniref:glycosyltransferase family 4 protein n=1 Tax=Vibrio jasicida TaxID=766224 RepID=UPI000CE49D3E|nr:glycosyltransferase family 4 protein [Vibrio jasicida]
MKSVVITSNAYFPNIGGIENSLRYLAQSYVEQGYKVHVVVSDVNTVSEQPLLAFEELENVRIYRYPTTHVLPKLLQPFAGLWTLKALFSTLKYVNEAYHPEFVVSRFHTNTWLAKLAGMVNVVYLLPGVVKYQNHPARLSQQSGLNKVKQNLRYHYHKWLQQRALKNADQLAVFSENMVRQVNSCYRHPKSLLLVKPGVDSSRFVPLEQKQKSELRKSLGLPDDKLVLLCVGRFVEAKGFRLVIEAMSSLPDCHLLLVGGGEQEGLYKQLVAEYTLESQITFSGVVLDPTQYYQASDLFIMSSTYEPLGQTILEALACALPIVAFKSSGQVITATTELLSDSEAAFVDLPDAELLAIGINHLQKKPEVVLHLAKQSRNIAKTRYTWAKLALNLKEAMLENKSR